MYYVLIFEYYGYGNFTGHCYNNLASASFTPTVDPLDYFMNEHSDDPRLHKIIHSTEQLETKKYLGLFTHNTVRSNPEEYLIECRGIGTEIFIQKSAVLDELYKKMERYEDYSVNFWDKELFAGDVIGFNLREASSNIVHICVFKQQLIQFEKEAGEKIGRTFFKILDSGAIKHGHVVLPTLLGKETERSLRGIESIIINGLRWKVKYNKKLRFIYGLKKLITYFALMECDSLHFSFDAEVAEGDVNNTQVNKVKMLPEEEVATNEDVAKVPGTVNVGEDVDMIGNQTKAQMQESKIYQFYKKNFGRNLNNRCHGVNNSFHLPTNIMFHNRDWKSGKYVKFRTGQSTWDIKIVVNDRRARIKSAAIKSRAGQAKVTGTIIYVGGAMLLSFYHGSKVPIGESPIHRNYVIQNSQDPSNQNNHQKYLVFVISQIASSNFEGVVQAVNPPEFKGSLEPIEANVWLKEIEKAFILVKVKEKQKVEFASYYLKNEATYWWEMVKALEGTDAITWERF
ncbi:hypothetical protein AgCh_021783 [Apium graveolens]